jgi:hypothetical protein
MTTIKGVDRSVQSLPCPTVEVNGVVVDNATVTFNEAVPSPTTTLTPDNFTANPSETPKSSLPEPTIYGAIIRIVNGVVTPTLAVLLYDVLGVIDASIPNKDQNRAVKRIIHDGFDKAYMDILREAYPDSSFAFGPGHTLTPIPDKSNAILAATLKS